MIRRCGDAEAGLTLHEREWVAQFLARTGRMFETSLSPQSKTHFWVGDVHAIVYRLPVGYSDGKPVFRYGWRAWVDDGTRQKIGQGTSDELVRSVCDAMTTVFDEHVGRAIKAYE